jgi:hypothetical protein
MTFLPDREKDYEKIPEEFRIPLFPAEYEKKVKVVGGDGKKYRINPYWYTCNCEDFEIISFRRQYFPGDVSLICLYVFFTI